MCVSSKNLHFTVEAVAVILLTISVVTIGASVNLLESTTAKLASVVTSLLNILFNIFLVFGIKDKSKFFLFIWMMSALCNVIGGFILLGVSSYNYNANNSNFTNTLNDILPLNIVKNVLLALYVGLYTWSCIQVFHLYKAFSSVTKMDPHKRAT